jgi:hypothetical protein
MAPSRSLPEALFLGSADGGSFGVPSGDRSAIGAVLAGADPAIACTATVIAAGVALTAAHCDDGDGIAFRLGEGAVAMPIRDARSHPTLDVMVFRFDQDGGEQPRPLALFDGPIDADWEGQVVTLAGVGRTETGDIGELRFAREPIVEVSTTELRVDGMGRSGACGGDSGGPLLVENPEGTPQIVGILERGAGSCLGVDVYARVDAFAAWLRAATGTSTPAARCE